MARERLNISIPLSITYTGPKDRAAAIKAVREHVGAATQMKMTMAGSFSLVMGSARVQKPKRDATASVNLDMRWEDQARLANIRRKGF